MVVYGKPSEHIRKQLYLDELEGIGTPFALYRVIGTPNCIAVCSADMYVDLYSINEIIVEEANKVPLWKQDMNMRMGRRTTQTVSRKIMRVTPIDFATAQHTTYRLYEVRR